MIVTSHLRRPPGCGRPHAHPPHLVTTVIPIGIERPLHAHVYKRVKLQGQARRIAILGGGMSTPVFNTAPPSSQNEYFVDVPRGVYPGEAFRLNIEGDEFLIVCPDIAVEGERIVVSIVRQ